MRSMLDYEIILLFNFIGNVYIFVTLCLVNHSVSDVMWNNISDNNSPVIDVCITRKEEII